MGWFTETTTTITTYDTSTSYVPTVAGNIKIEAWGAGGGGGGQGSATSDGGGGGGGGAYSRVNSFFVKNGSTFSIEIGNGGSGGLTSAGTAGKYTYFKYGALEICRAAGGNPGLYQTGGTPPNGPRGGLDSSCLGDVKWNGGWGSAGLNGANGVGGGGGSSAVSDASGNSKVVIATASTVRLGYTAPSVEGGDGGAGGTKTNIGSNGLAPGGGGGGSGSDGTDLTGGIGANGRIIITATTLIYKWRPEICIT